MLECAPRHLRGGNSRHTRNLRCAHAAPTEILTEAYTEQELLEDLRRVNDGETDEALASLVAARSAECVPWMAAFGARFQAALRGTLHLARTNAFFLGGGTALMNSYYAAAERLGIEVRYDAEVIGAHAATTARFASATVRAGGAPHELQRTRSRARGRRLRGEPRLAARSVGRRGAQLPDPRHAVQHGHGAASAMLDAGAAPVGDPRECHAVAIDGRAPKFDGGIVTRLDCVPLGIVVNRNGERFYDEGEDFWPKRYAIWGKLVARQPGEIAYSIIDAKVRDRYMPSVYPPIEAASMRELAGKLGLPAERLEATVAAFNRAVQPGAFDHTTLDDCRTAGLAPDKSHWAQRHRHAALLRLSAAARHHVHVSRRARRSRGARARRPTARRSRTSTRPARSWPATCCGKATSPASA